MPELSNASKGIVSTNYNIYNFVSSAKGKLSRSAALPNDFRPMIVPLLAGENHRINGQRIEVSGGMLL
jgi:hypothetical protein